MFWRVFSKFVGLADNVTWRVREARWRGRLGSIGPNFVFEPRFSNFVTPETFSAGADCFLNVGAHVSGLVTLGDRVLIGPYVRLLSGNHLFGIEGYYARFARASLQNPEKLEAQTIESDSWIGANAIVLGGVTGGVGSEAAAGSVVTKDVPPFTVVAGVPARAVRRIFDDAALKRHMTRLRYDPEEIEAVLRRRRAASADLLPLADRPRVTEFYYGGEKIELESDDVG